ncbi:arginine--tRNA ligase [Parvimonas micra]|jgi:arginine--tRNA ligase|uniref:arginine--tRNA ligase n=1 Tax=Parvimonas micra TaxID=33033 RepID=UPI001CB0378F|nr:arginine--tRNA ligase [Parvimonas micra]MBF1203366.1 arginine--tRNA ligase [Fusobacterium periodonticum]MCE3019763.1 arginine--tRNA ligase [Parvimonas micra]
MIKFKDIVVDTIFNLDINLSKDEIKELIETPPNPEMGDYSFPCFKLSKELRKAPNIIAQELVNRINIEDSVFFKISNVGPYINFFIKPTEYFSNVISEMILRKYDYGSSKNNLDKTIVIDYSSTNIAKPFHIGHIRSTLIGNVIKNIYKFLGYNTIGVNHLGDYGTQFGKIIAAYKLWGNDDQINADPINQLLKLYVDFNNLCKTDENMLETARNYFNRLENGDEESVKLWNWFKDISLLEFQKVYDKLKVEFDSYRGEAYHSQFINDVVKELEEKNLLTESDGCKIVNLDKYNLPPALILKSNSSSTYITRDIATALTRKKDYNFSKNIYVVATQQKLHFEQLIAVLKEMGYEWANDCIHVSFGMVSVKDDFLGTSAKLSTREGNVIFLNDVLEKSVEKTLEIINERNNTLENKEIVAKEVGIGAVIFQELFNTRIKDYSFDWNNVLNFEGETGPYVQYSAARAYSILEKNDFYSKINNIDISKFSNYEMNVDELALVKSIYKFEDILLDSAKKYEPSILARYITEVAKLFNKFYNSCPINNQEENIKEFRLVLTYCSRILIEIGLGLLGMDTPKKM